MFNFCKHINTEVLPQILSFSLSLSLSPLSHLSLSLSLFSLSLSRLSLCFSRSVYSWRQLMIPFLFLSSFIDPPPPHSLHPQID